LRAVDAVTEENSARGGNASLKRRLRNAKHRREKLALSQDEAALYDALAGGVELAGRDPTPGGDPHFRSEANLRLLGSGALRESKVHGAG
jgi:hypothetical protein